MYKLIALLGLLPLFSLTGYLAAEAYVLRPNPTSALAIEISEFDSRRVESNWLEDFQSTIRFDVLNWISNGASSPIATKLSLEDANNLRGTTRQLHQDWSEIRKLFSSISEIATDFRNLPESDAFTTQSVPDLELPFKKIASKFLQTTEIASASRIKVIEEQLLRVGRENKNRVLERERLANNEGLLEYARSAIVSPPVDWILLSSRLREGFHGSLTPEQTQMLARSELWSDIQAAERNLQEAKKTFSRKDLLEDRELVRLLSQADISLSAAQAKSTSGNVGTLSDKAEIERKLQLLEEMRNESASNLERFRSNNAALEETLNAIKSDESPNWKELQKGVLSKWQGELSLRGEQLILKLDFHGQLEDLKTELVRIEAMLHPGQKASLPDLEAELKQYVTGAERFQKELDGELRLGLTDRQEINAKLAQVEASYRNITRGCQELETNLALVTELTDALVAETANIPLLREKLSVGWKGAKRPELNEISFRLDFREQLQSLAKALKSVEESAVDADLSWGRDAAQSLDDLTANLLRSRNELAEFSTQHPADERRLKELSDQLEQLRMKQSLWCSWQDSKGEVKVWLERTTALLDADAGKASKAYSKNLFPKIVDSCLSIKKSQVDEEIRYAISASGKYYEGVFIPMENYYRFWPEIELYRKTPETGFERKPRNFFKTEPAIPPEARLVSEYNEARANLLKNVFSKESWTAFLDKLEELQLETERYAGKQKTIHYLEEIKFCKDLLGSWEQAQLFLR
jgi:hypothetical protein